MTWMRLFFRVTSFVFIPIFTASGKSDPSVVSPCTAKRSSWLRTITESLQRTPHRKSCDVSTLVFCRRGSSDFRGLLTTSGLAFTSKPCNGMYSALSFFHCSNCICCSNSFFPASVPDWMVSVYASFGSGTGSFRVIAVSTGMTSPSTGSYPVPLTWNFCGYVRMERAVIWLVVSVPVLSEQITDTAPVVSTAGIERIKAFCLAIRCIPMARVRETMAGRPSGTTATPIDAPYRKAPPHEISWKWTNLTQRKAMTMRTRVMITRMCPNWVICRVRGVFSCFTLATMELIFPISVRTPVSTHTAVPVPLATYVLEKSMFDRSPRTVSTSCMHTNFGFAVVSPVRAASSVCS
ncbi:hypothetical protein BLNAU_14609 [Blattamonas nauphoetae]|uniref:Secreted protein n=1 Tax=Blattamonas nauphoetae TaxID=2049346 RepID=A0ABQ9XEU6_9EUKA|nr:hypothetical protein BLNAU_14609 [Blattamonas nauphoetae]